MPKEKTSSFVIDFKAVFDNYMAKNQKVWAHDRSTTVGASEAFNCMRQLFCEKRAEEFDIEPDETYEERWGAIERGNIIENHFVVPAMDYLPNPVEALFVGDDQYTHVLQRSSATPDGLLINVPTDREIIIRYGDDEFTIDRVPTGCIGLEIKSIVPRAHLDEERTKHMYQSQIGMGIIREITDWKPEYWVILYIDASWLDNIKPFVITYDPKIYKVAKKRATDVYKFKNIKEAMPEGKLDGGCKYCRWRQACGEAVVSEIKNFSGTDLSPVALAELGPLVEKALDLKVKAEEADLAYAEAQQRVKEWLTNNRKSKAKSENWAVSWSTSEGKESLDKKALEAAGVDLKKYMKKGAPYDTFRITART